MQGEEFSFEDKFDNSGGDIKRDKNRVKRFMKGSISLGHRSLLKVDPTNKDKFHHCNQNGIKEGDIIYWEEKYYKIINLIQSHSTDYGNDYKYDNTYYNVAEVDDKFNVISNINKRLDVSDCCMSSANFVVAGNVKLEYPKLHYRK